VRALLAMFCEALLRAGLPCDVPSLRLPAAHASILRMQVAGLYMVGASTRPGNGVPLVMISAELATQRVLKDAAAGVF
jgi:phytoene dehydrogenase-like protein